MLGEIIRGELGDDVICARAYSLADKMMAERGLAVNSPLPSRYDSLIPGSWRELAAIMTREGLLELARAAEAGGRLLADKGEIAVSEDFHGWLTRRARDKATPAEIRRWITSYLLPRLTLS